MTPDLLAKMAEDLVLCLDMNCLPDEIENYLLSHPFYDDSGEEIEVLTEDFDWKVTLTLSHNNQTVQKDECCLRNRETPGPGHESSGV